MQAEKNALFYLSFIWDLLCLYISRTGLLDLHFYYILINSNASICHSAIIQCWRLNWFPTHFAIKWPFPVTFAWWGCIPIFLKRNRSRRGCQIFCRYLWQTDKHIGVFTAHSICLLWYAHICIWKFMRFLLERIKDLTLTFRRLLNQ